MLILTSDNIYITEGEGVYFKDSYTEHYIKKYNNILKDIEEHYIINDCFTDIENDTAQIVFDGIIKIKIKKEDIINTINIEKKNRTFITTNQQYIYTETELKKMLDILLVGYLIV